MTSGPASRQAGAEIPVARRGIRKIPARRNQTTLATSPVPNRFRVPAGAHRKIQAVGIAGARRKHALAQTIAASLHGRPRGRVRATRQASGRTLSWDERGTLRRSSTIERSCDPRGLRRHACVSSAPALRAKRRAKSRSARVVKRQSGKNKLLRVRQSANRYDSTARQQTLSSRGARHARWPTGTPRMHGLFRDAIGERVDNSACRGRTASSLSRDNDARRRRHKRIVELAVHRDPSQVAGTRASRERQPPGSAWRNHHAGTHSAQWIASLDQGDRSQRKLFLPFRAIRRWPGRSRRLQALAAHALTVPDASSAPSAISSRLRVATAAGVGQSSDSNPGRQLQRKWETPWAISGCVRIQPTLCATAARRAGTERRQAGALLGEACEFSPLQERETRVGIEAAVRGRVAVDDGAVPARSGWIGDMGAARASSSVDECRAAADRSAKARHCRTSTSASSPSMALRVSISSGRAEHENVPSERCVHGRRRADAGSARSGKSSPGALVDARCARKAASALLRALRHHVRCYRNPACRHEEPWGQVFPSLRFAMGDRAGKIQ